MTTTEWELATWSNNLLDTRVKLTKGSNEIIGVLRSLDAGDHRIMVDGGGIVSLGRPGAWSVSTEKVAVVVPTVPGWYVGLDRMTDRPLPVFVTGGGVITHPVNGTMLGGPERFAPFTRLRPEAEVVAEVLAKMADRDTSGTGMSTDRKMVAAEYGVTL